MGIVIAVLSAVFFAAIFRGAWNDLQSRLDAADADDEAFEQRRARRQAEFDRHWQAVCHAELMDTCEMIYIGRWERERQ